MPDQSLTREQLLENALTEICQRLEAPIPDGVETHRELSAHRARLLETIYAVAENALALTPSE